MAKSKGAGPGVAAGMPIQRSGTPSADLAGPLKKSDYFLEAGNTGLKIFGGFVAEEFDPNLRGMRGARMYREMSDSDPTIGAYLYLIFQAVLKLNWHLSPADQSPLSLLAQEALESMMDDMDGTWDEFIQEALTMVIYGYAPMEITLKLRNGSKPDKRFSSIYDDGLVGIRKIALRSQETVLRWIMDPDNNDILGVVQMPWTGGIRMIPMSKMLLFRTRSYRGNPEGRSLLRNAYRPYYFCKRIEEIEGIGVERDLAGFPVMSVPAETIAAAAQGTDANAVATLEAYKNLVKNIRRNSQEGAVLPSDTDDHGHKMFELTLLSSGGKRNFDTNMIISRYNMQKAATVMADFLMMGHGGASGGGGSRGGGIGSDKIELFYAAIEGLVGSMRDTMNKNLIPLICQLNGVPQKYWPAFFTDKAEQVDLGKLGAYINSLAASGMVLFPNEDLEDYLLETAGLPTPTEEVRAQQQNIQEQGGETGPGMGGAAQPGQRPSPTAQPPGGMPGQGQPGAAGDPRMGAQGAYGQQPGGGVASPDQAPHKLFQQGGGEDGGL